MQNIAWWHDFRFSNGVMHVKKTGAAVPIDWGVIGDTATWLNYHVCIEALRLTTPTTGAKIWFAPDRPRPWYLIWPVIHLAGLRVVHTPEDADIAFFFEDLTHSPIPTPPTPLPMINGACGNAAKSQVAEIFEHVFARALQIDPTRYDGAFVEKSELNGAHDGQIHHSPCAPQPGRVYQRLIDNLADDGCVEDLRCPTVGGEIPLVFIKRRPKDQRFANMNTEVHLIDPAQVFTDEERAQIKAFCQAMQLDWGGIDVLRDRRDGQIWIVDVNKTDMGPPIRLPLKDKLKASHILAQTLKNYISQRLEGPIHHDGHSL